MPEPIQATTSEPMTMPTNPPTVAGVDARARLAILRLAERLDNCDTVWGNCHKAEARDILNGAPTGDDIPGTTPPHPPAAQTPAPPASEQASGFCTHMDLPNGVVWSQTGWYLRLRDGHWRWVCDLTEIDTDAVRSVRNAIASEPAPTPKAEPKPAEERVRWFRLKDDHDDYWRVDPIGEVLFNWGSGTSPSLRPTMNETLQTLLSNECLEEFFPDSPAHKDAESVGEAQPHDIADEGKAKPACSCGHDKARHGYSAFHGAIICEDCGCGRTQPKPAVETGEIGEDWLPEGMGAIERDGIVRWSSDYVYDRDSQWRGVVREQTRLYGQAVAECLSLRSQLAAMTERAEPEEREPNENKPIGRCPKCQTPVYTDEGFCGGCRAGI